MLEYTVVLLLREHYGDQELLLFTYTRRIGSLDSVLEYLDRTREEGTIFAKRILGEFSVILCIVFCSNRRLYLDDRESDPPTPDHFVLNPDAQHGTWPDNCDG